MTEKEWKCIYENLCNENPRDWEIPDLLGVDLPDEETKAAYSEFIGEWAEEFQE